MDFHHHVHLTMLYAVDGKFPCDTIYEFALDVEPFFVGKQN